MDKVTKATLQPVVHCTAKYAKDLREGLIQNVMVGGDSAGRGLLMGMVLGAYHGFRAIPKAWIEKLQAGPKIRACVEQIEQARRQQALTR